MQCIISCFFNRCLPHCHGSNCAQVKHNLKHYFLTAATSSFSYVNQSLLSQLVQGLADCKSLTVLQSLYPQASLQSKYISVIGVEVTITCLFSLAWFDSSVIRFHSKYLFRNSIYLTIYFLRNAKKESELLACQNCGKRLPPQLHPWTYQSH